MEATKQTKWPPLCVILLFLSVGLTTVHAEGGVAANRAVACSKSTHFLGCPMGLIILVREVSFGAPLASRGCTSDSPREVCCDPRGQNCVFTAPGQMEDYTRRCRGTIECEPFAKSISVPKGACGNDSELYMPYSTFNFIEYECLRIADLHNLCSPQNIDTERQGKLYLDSNYIMGNKDVVNSSCTCHVVTSSCQSTLTFTAVDVTLRDDDDVCVEELEFQDLTFPVVTLNTTCSEGRSVQNKVLFESLSNTASLAMHVTGRHAGRILIRVTSSNQSDTLRLLCGSAAEETLNTIPKCPVTDGPPLDQSTSPSNAVTDEASSPIVPSKEISTTGSDQTSDAPPRPGRPTTSAAPWGFINSPSPSSSSSSSSINGGVIAGIVLASIAILLVSVLIILFICNKRKQPTDVDNDIYFGYATADDTQSTTASDYHGDHNRPSVPSSHFHNQLYAMSHQTDPGLAPRGAFQGPPGLAPSGAVGGQTSESLDLEEKKLGLPGPEVVKPTFEDVDNDGYVSFDGLDDASKK